MLTWRIWLSGDCTFYAPHTTGTDCPATLTSGSNVPQTPLSSQKLRQNEVIMRISKQGSRTFAFSQHSGERTLISRSAG